jgi:hypothetical protein
LLKLQACFLTIAITMFHSTTYEPPVELEKTLGQIEAKLPEHLRKPKVGVVCGSGLSKLAEGMKDIHLIPYRDLHGFTSSTGQFFNFLLTIKFTSTGFSCWAQK